MLGSYGIIMITAQFSSRRYLRARKSPYAIHALSQKFPKVADNDDDAMCYQDFWLTVLYKRIVRGPVFNATAGRRDVRVYAACANPEK